MDDKLSIQIADEGAALLKKKNINLIKSLFYSLNITSNIVDPKLQSTPLMLLTSC